MNESFHEDFNLNNQIEKGVGTGDALALEFMIDNGGLFDSEKAQINFKVGVSSILDIFEQRSVSIPIKPGNKMDIDVEPIEVVAEESLRDVPISKRNCRFADEYEGVMEIFNFYSQSACNFECLLRDTRKICQCTPWNMPTPIDDQPICDIYGNICFDNIMQQQIRLANCTCPIDCNTVRFRTSISQKSIDLNEYCSRLGKGMSYIAQKVIYELNPLLIDYFHIKNEGFLGLSEDNGEYICRRALMQNMAIVSVKFGSPRYMRTVMSKRYSLSDKIGTLGGTLSLFTGMSFLSVFELAFWLIKLLVQMTLPNKRFKVSFLM